ncbi:MAG: DnaJ domain-containing protein [Terracidiphilus sp.]
MKLCMCGDTVADACTFCARCAALQTLELHRGATAEEIKAAYHLLVKVWHPDRFPSDKKLRGAAEEKLKAINSAYLILTSTPKKRGQGRPPQKDASSSPGAQGASKSPQAPATAAVRSRGRRLRAYLATFAALSVVQRLLVVACGIGVSALFMKFIDSQVASDPATARVYSEYKSAMAAELEEPRRRFLEKMEQSLQNLDPLKPSPAPATYPSPQAANPAPERQTPVAHAAKKIQPATIHLLPYITVGLTKDEVLAVAGTPASASEDKLTYKGAEIYLKDGKVAGWNIDPVASPLRVKLWPDAPVDTDLEYFSLGSTRNDVLVVQGTPTSFSENKFGYGASEVYFQNNRVVSWKNDPASVTLRAISR